MKEHESEGWDACINQSHETNCRLKLVYNSSKCRLRAKTIQLLFGTIHDYICRFSYTSASLKNRPYTLQINVLSSQLLKIATRGAPSHTANNGINMWHALHYFWGNYRRCRYTAVVSFQGDGNSWPPWELFQGQSDMLYAPPPGAILEQQRHFSVICFHRQHV